MSRSKVRLSGVLISQLQDHGVSYRKMADLFGVDHMTVFRCHKSYQESKSPTSHTRCSTARLIDQLYMKGNSYRKIAKILDTNLTAVYKSHQTLLQNWFSR